MEAKVIHLVDGKKAENGYEFSDYSEPRKPNMGSMYDFMASTYTGEYIIWYEGKTLAETVFEHLKEYNSCHSDNVFEYGSLYADVNWEYNENEKIFCANWIESGEPTGEVFKVESIRYCREGQTFAEGKSIEF